MECVGHDGGTTGQNYLFIVSSTADGRHNQRICTIGNIGRMHVIESDLSKLTEDRKNHAQEMAKAVTTNKTLTE